MRTPLATLTLTMALGLAGLASADVYKCPAPGGKTVYQDAPCAGADEPVIISQEPGSASMPPPRAPHVPGAASWAGIPLPHAPHNAPARGGTAVDTHAFGMLGKGMSEAEVVRRLGPPDHVVEDARTFVPVRYSSGRVELREQRRAAWVYAGDSQTLKTVLTFENGRMVNKAKGR